MNLAECMALAEFAHNYLPKKPQNKYDKSGALYIEHPLRVLKSVQAQGARPYAQMAAVLHDVTEDTKVTAEMLLAFGVPEAAVNIVVLMDRGLSRKEFHRLNPDYDGPIHGDSRTAPGTWPQIDEYYYAQIRKNPDAVQVKLADIGDNLQPWRLSYLSEQTQVRLREKYAKAIKELS